MRPWHALFSAGCRRRRAAGRKLARGLRAVRREPMPAGLEASILATLGVPEGGSPIRHVRSLHRSFLPARVACLTAACVLAGALAVGALLMGGSRIGRSAGVKVAELPIPAQRVLPLKDRRLMDFEEPSGHRRLGTRRMNSRARTAQSRPAPTPGSVRAGGLRAFLAAVSTAGSQPDDAADLHQPTVSRTDLPGAASARAGNRGDLTYLNTPPGGTPRRWRRLSQREPAAETGLPRRLKRGDEFVTVPFPRIAAAGPDSDRSAAEAVAAYEREAAVVDGRLAGKVTLAVKATALADLCSQLRSDTGIQLGAGQSVADEKVTLFCKQMPLRDVMRQLSRPFGYAWLRSGKPGEYKYELVQDLRSQLAEEELRNRDRDAALIALDREIERYRKYLSLSPEEAEARAQTAPAAEKKLLENLGRHGWGAIQMYFRLSRNDLAALRAGQTLSFSAAPKPGEQPLPPGVARGVLQGLRYWRVKRHDDRFAVYGSDEAAEKVPDWLPPASVPEVRARVALSINQSELGRFAFTGGPSIFTGGDAERGFNAGGPNGPWAVGVSPAVLQPDNATLNARLARDPALRARVTVRPQPVCRLEPFPGRMGTPGGSESAGEAPEPRVTTADVLEALHRASGLPVVSDYYTRLYKPEAVSPRSVALFDALNQLADTMRLRWNRDKEAGWLQFRSTSFYDDRLKEVPNRLLARWAASRRQRGMLTLDDLAEIAQLPDAQLDAVSMAEGARACFGLTEWELARHEWLRPQLRYLATLTPPQRQEAVSPAGLPFTRMSLAQQQQYIALALPGDDEPLQSVEELSGAMLRIEYTQPGWYRRAVPGENWPQWVVTLEPGRQGRRAQRPPVLERTRAAALQAARQQDAQVQEAEIVSTRLSLTFFYMPGTSNRRDIHLVGNDAFIYWSTW